MKIYYKYIDLWRSIFEKSVKRVVWQGEWLDNSFCAVCQHCCGPQDEEEPFPMALLPSQLRPGLEDDFYLLDPETACLDRRGCKALSTNGCRLPRASRPFACGLFPLVLANGCLYLYSICPATLYIPLTEWIGVAEQAGEWLSCLPATDLRRISLDISAETLADRYIFLHIRLF